MTDQFQIKCQSIGSNCISKSRRYWTFNLHSSLSSVHICGISDSGLALRNQACSSYKYNKTSQTTVWQERPDIREGNSWL